MNKDKKNKIIMTVLLLITIISIGITIHFVFFHHPDQNLLPDYNTIPDDPNVENLGDFGDSKLDKSEGGGSVSIVYDPNIEIDLKTNMITLNYKNPSRSNESVILQLYIQGIEMSRSGSITPGHSLSTMTLNNKANIVEGGYKGKLVASFYDSDTKEKALVNSELDVEIIVK